MATGMIRSQMIQLLHAVSVIRCRGTASVASLLLATLFGISTGAAGEAGLPFLSGAIVVSDDSLSPSYSALIYVNVQSIPVFPTGTIDIRGAGGRCVMTLDNEPYASCLFMPTLPGLHQPLIAHYSGDALYAPADIPLEISVGQRFDIDGDGIGDALTDGLSIYRYLLEDRGMSASTITLFH